MKRFGHGVHGLRLSRSGEAQFNVQPEFFKQGPGQVVADLVAPPVAMVSPGGERLKDSAVEERFLQRQNMVDRREMVASGAGQMQRSMVAAGHQNEVGERGAAAVVAPFRVGQPWGNQQQVAAAELNSLVRKTEFTPTLKLEKKFRLQVVEAVGHLLPHAFGAGQYRFPSLPAERLQRGQKPLLRPAPVGVGKMEFGQCKRSVGHSAPFGE